MILQKASLKPFLYNSHHHKELGESALILYRHFIGREMEKAGTAGDRTKNRSLKVKQQGESESLGEMQMDTTFSQSSLQMDS